MCARGGIGGGAGGRARPTVQSGTRWAEPSAGARVQPSARPATLGPRCVHHTHSFIVRRFFRSQPSTGRPDQFSISRVSSNIIIIPFVVVAVVRRASFNIYYIKLRSRRRAFIVIHVIACTPILYSVAIILYISVHD